MSTEFIRKYVIVFLKWSTKLASLPAAPSFPGREDTGTPNGDACALHSRFRVQLRGRSGDRAGRLTGNDRDPGWPVWRLRVLRG